MRFVIGMMKHETNTFSPVPTPLASFGKQGPLFGIDAYNAYKGTNTPMGAYIDIALGEGADVVTPVAAQAWPSGVVDGEAYESIVGVILEEVRRGCDALSPWLICVSGSSCREKSNSPSHRATS